MKKNQLILCLQTGRLAALIAGIVFGVAAMAMAQPVPVQYQTVYALTNLPLTNDYGPASGVVVGPDYALYGATIGTGTGPTNAGFIFKVGPNGANFQMLHRFGSNPNDGVNNNFLSSYLNVLRQTANLGALLVGADGMLYGTTTAGGSNNLGTVYRIAQNGANYQIIHQFNGSTNGDAQPAAGLIQANNGLLYGTCLQGAIYALTTDGSGYQVLTNLLGNPLSASGSYDPLIQGQDGGLYGTYAGWTSYYGQLNSGGVFRINLDGTGFTILHAFDTVNNSVNMEGFLPIANLVQTASGRLLGAAAKGGTNGFGTLFMLATNGSDFQVTYTFPGLFPDGTGYGGPVGGLVTGPGGRIYGNTYGNGYYYPVVFSIDQQGGNFQTNYVYNGGYFNVGNLSVGPGASPNLYGGISGFRSSNTPLIYSLLVNPPLTITLQNQQGLISWPAWAVNYTLQTSPTLNGPWTPVTNGVPVVGVQLPASTNSSTVYRLINTP